MAKKIIGLGEKSAEKFQEMLRSEHNRPRNTQGRGRDPSRDTEDWLGPEVYIGRTFQIGIPALDENVTGTGTTKGDDEPGVNDNCQIYQRVTVGGLEVLRPIGTTRRVYNIFPQAIPANSWFLAVRDKFGTWLAVRPISTGSSSSICQEITVVTNVCTVFIPGTATSGPIDATVVEYTTYDLTTCEIVDRYCLRNPMACCLECNGNIPPELITATYSEISGTDCTCADGVEIEMRYMGIVTTAIEPTRVGDHYWEGTGNWGTCTSSGKQIIATQRLFLTPGSCTYANNLRIRAFDETGQCHNTTTGVSIQQYDPFHLTSQWASQNDGGPTISCSPYCGFSLNGNLLQVDFVETP